MIWKRVKEAHRDLRRDVAESTIPLSSEDLSSLSSTAERYLPSWNDSASSLSKWILATLITLNSGGVFFLFNLGLHPYAVREAGLYFFLGIGAALLAALFQFARIERMRAFIFRVDMALVGGLKAPSALEYRKAFNTPFSSLLALFFGVLSFWLLFQGGGEIIRAMQPCGKGFLEESEYWKSYQIPLLKGGHHSCYFYDIPGIPLDPLQRAHWEQNALKSMKAIKE